MEFISEGFRSAFLLIFSLDREVFSVTFLTLVVSSTATLLASLLGVPLGFTIGTQQFRGRRLTITFFNTLLSLPTVVVGLFVFSLISRQGQNRKVCWRFGVYIELREIQFHRPLHVNLPWAMSIRPKTFGGQFVPGFFQKCDDNRFICILSNGPQCGSNHTDIPRQRAKE